MTKREMEQKILDLQWEVERLKQRQPPKRCPPWVVPPPWDIDFYKFPRYFLGDQVL